MKSKTLLVAAVSVTGLLVIAQANLSRPGIMPTMISSAMATSSDAASAQAFGQAMDVMMKDMMMPYTGDADAVFARSMIPHHQGAIDMAKVVLEHGKDPEIRNTAEEVINAEEREIAFLKEWLQKNTN